jgi:hypothetical protein
MKTTQLNFWWFTKAMLGGLFIALLASYFPLLLIVGSVLYLALAVAYKLLVINKKK